MLLDFQKTVMLVTVGLSSDLSIYTVMNTIIC